jgi:hypothetical protein
MKGDIPRLWVDVSFLEWVTVQPTLVAEMNVSSTESSFVSELQSPWCPQSQGAVLCSPNKPWQGLEIPRMTSPGPGVGAVHPDGGYSTMGPVPGTELSRMGFKSTATSGAGGGAGGVFQVGILRASGL